MKEAIKKLFSFFEDSDGRFSSSRLMGAILIIAFVHWGNTVVSCGKGIPDIPIQLAGLIVTLYGINKLHSVLKGKV